MSIDSAGLAAMEDDELLALARIDFEKERFEASLVRVKEVVRRGGKLATVALAEVARVHARLRLFARAQAEYTAYLKEFPDAVNERFQLGMAHFDAGEVLQALEIWEALLARHRLHPPALYFSALASAQLGRLGLAYERCRTIAEKVDAENLYSGRARELSQKIEADPRWKQERAEADRMSGGIAKTH